MKLSIGWLVAILVLLAVGVGQAQVDTSTSPFTGNGPHFRDVAPDYWAYDYIEAIAKANITHGCMRLSVEDCPGAPEGNNALYCPEGIVTRAQMAAFVGRAMRFGFDGFQHFNEYFPAEPTFVDIADNGLSPWIEAIANPVEAGAPEGTKPVTIGCSVDTEGTRIYCPDREITRAEMAVFLVRAFKLDTSGYDPQDSTTWVRGFSGCQH